MTDLQSYTDLDGNKVAVKRAKTLPDALFLDFTGPDDGGPRGVIIPSSRLLAMIDRADPNAMRGYLRERSDYLDSPDGPAAEHFDYLEPVKVTPEADSPEDVDEHPDRGSRLYALQQVAAILPRDALLEDLLDAAEWVHAGIRVHTLGAIEAAEVIS